MKLSVIGDEVGYDIQDQLSTINQFDIKNIEIRKIKGINIVDCSDSTIKEVIDCIIEKQINVSMISTNIGKKSRKIEQVYRDFDKALNLAANLRCKFIRIFSDIEKDEQENLACINNLISCAEKEKVTLVLENEINTYADNPVSCQKILSGTNGRIGLLYDAGNFYKCGFSIKEMFAEFSKHIVYIHLKDMQKDSYEWCYLGEGELDVLPFLKHLFHTDFKGYISLEPHFCVENTQQRKQYFSEYMKRFYNIIQKL